MLPSALAASRSEEVGLDGNMLLVGGAAKAYDAHGIAAPSTTRRNRLMPFEKNLSVWTTSDFPMWMRGGRRERPVGLWREPVKGRCLQLFC